MLSSEHQLSSSSESWHQCQLERWRCVRWSRRQAGAPPPPAASHAPAPTNHQSFTTAVRTASGRRIGLVRRVRAWVCGSAAISATSYTGAAGTPTATGSDHTQTPLACQLPAAGVCRWLGGVYLRPRERRATRRWCGRPTSPPAAAPVRRGNATVRCDPSRPSRERSEQAETATTTVVPAGSGHD